METMHERKTKVVEEILRRLYAQTVQNRIYRIGQKHFRCYHVFDKKEKSNQYAFSFYYGISRNILEDMQGFQDPHILIICDHKNPDLYGEDAVDLLFIPAGIFLGNLEGVSFKPSSVEKGDPSWNMNIRVTQDRKYLLDIPGKDNIPLGSYLNRFIDLGILHEIDLKHLTSKIEKSELDMQLNENHKESVEPEYGSWSKASRRSGALAPPIEECEAENNQNSDGICHVCPGRSSKLIGFMSYIEEGENFIGGYLATDEELMPVEFIVTNYIKPATKLQKILHGAQFDMKWFGDLIAGTLFEGAKKTEVSDEKRIGAFFVSDERMLHLRNKTGDTPVVFIGDNDRVIVHTQYTKDEEQIIPILEKVKKYSEVSEVLKRINEGIKEKISSGFEGGK